MKMRNFLTSALVVTSLCIASVAMADLARVNIVMDISDPDNVTLTNYEENGTYGGQWFAIDALEFCGAVSVTYRQWPIVPVPDPDILPLGIMYASDGVVSSLAADTVWMIYGFEYSINGSLSYSNYRVNFLSSDPDDFYCVDGDDIYPRSFIVVDATDSNGLGGVKFLGTIIPEPTSMSLLAFGALAIIRRRRR